MQDTELNQKIKIQRDFYHKGLTRTMAHRVTALKSLQKAIKLYQPQIEAAISQDLGRPATETFMAEISPVLHEIKLALKNIGKWQHPRRTCSPYFLWPAKAKLYREPFGVCLIIAPWNYPVSLCLQPLVSAIAGGNCVTVKPSRQAPATSAVLTAMLTDTFNAEFIQVVQGEEHETILEYKFDFIFFTGGTETGKTVMTAAAKHLTPVVLELGGKSPCIIDPRFTDLKTAAKRIMWGKFFNAGQTCIAPDYLLVPATIKGELISHLKSALTRFYGQKPTVGINYTHIINNKAWQRLNGLLEAEKDKIVWGGETNEQSLYIAPTLFDNVDWDSPLMQAELFGPLLPILTYESLGELIPKLLERPEPLALYMFSNDKAFQQTLVDKLSFGGGCINATMLHYINPKLPFGGVGASGMGHYHGQYGFETFTRLKPLLNKALNGEPNLQYPPYSKIKQKLLRKLF